MARFVDSPRGSQANAEQTRELAPTRLPLQVAGE